MQELLVPYHSAVVGLLVLAVLTAIQFAISDVAGIRAKHVPGMPITDGHKSFLFRATRAYANTYENLGFFLLLVLICVFTAASPKWTSILVWVFTAARAAHMTCYYADLRTLRSIAFAIGSLAELGLLAAAFQAI
jgi:uncharacterized MAPEG superfamily protein